MELVIRVEGAELPASLTLPSGHVRAGVVVLHGAEAGERSYFLYEHLADVLEPERIAVLRYDRRPSSDGHDVPLRTQAADALAALRQLRELVNQAPVGLWGFSQGAWAAPLAAVTDPDSVAFLICVSCCGVSPAEQMRVGCSKQLRKHGYNEIDVADGHSTCAGGIRSCWLHAAPDRPLFPTARVTFPNAGPRECLAAEGALL